jgi:YfiR/HmsC-like
LEPKASGSGIGRDGAKFMRFRATLIVCLILTLLRAVEGTAEEAQLSEYRVKAAFVFNFAKFVEWPAESFSDDTSQLIIGILGENPFGTDLEQTIQGKTINSHPLAIRQMRSLNEIAKCHILFVSASETKRLAEIFHILGEKSILTVGEAEGFNEGGGMINFTWEGKKIRFQINDDAAKKAKLKISSKLLSLALRRAP